MSPSLSGHMLMVGGGESVGGGGEVSSGVAVGVSVGVVLGSSVGPPVGAPVGVGVGACVGPEVGVGVAVGLAGALDAYRAFMVSVSALPVTFNPADFWKADTAAAVFDP